LSCIDYLRSICWIRAATPPPCAVRTGLAIGADGSDLVAPVASVRDAGQVRGCGWRRRRCGISRSGAAAQCWSPTCVWGYAGCSNWRVPIGLDEHIDS